MLRKLPHERMLKYYFVCVCSDIIFQIYCNHCQQNENTHCIALTIVHLSSYCGKYCDSQVADWRRSHGEVILLFFFWKCLVSVSLSEDLC